MSATLLVLLLSPSWAPAAGAPEVSFGQRVASARADVRRAEIPVKGMSCAKCAANIQDALEHLAGVREIRIDLRAGVVSVTYDPAKVTVERIVETIRSVGYEPGAPRDASALPRHG